VESLCSAIAGRHTAARDDDDDDDAAAPVADDDANADVDVTAAADAAPDEAGDGWAAWRLAWLGADGGCWCAATFCEAFCELANFGKEEEVVAVLASRGELPAPPRLLDCAGGAAEAPLAASAGHLVATSRHGAGCEAAASAGAA